MNNWKQMFAEKYVFFTPGQLKMEFRNGDEVKLTISVNVS